MKKLLKYILIGYLSGAVMGNVISMLSTMSLQHFFSDALLARTGSPAGAIIVQTLLSALIGAAGFGGMLLYKTELPLAAATVIHFGLIEAVFIPVSLILGWIPFALKDIGLMSGIMFAAFAVIWIGMFIHYKRSVKELNEITKRK
ncbi:MAG: DUF3021 domain-containing protein [Clostridia bacterium]|nr:DUF3021 domain-containing protein [Clostridia bacterium]